MAKLVYDGNYHVYWLDTAPANTSSPTTAEITAGTDLTAFLPKDGINPNVTNNRVNGGDLSTTFADESMGTWKAAMTIKAYLDDAANGNTAWDTLTDRATGCLVMTPFAASAAGVAAYVFPDVQLGTRIPAQTAENARQTFTVDVAVRAEPVLDASVAA